ncbi:uncharacterized protein [Typha latifolia]|uniref:uncharacterized protein n=1 Tax=Typha latifolia TaxID=4733 RepID=UPI003C3031F7
MIMKSNTRTERKIERRMHYLTNLIPPSLQPIHLLVLKPYVWRRKTFDEFYAKLSDIVNSSFNLGEKIPENSIVRKILRSLLERFQVKVTAIEESKDIDSMKVEQLVEKTGIQKEEYLKSSTAFTKQSWKNASKLKLNLQTSESSTASKVNFSHIPRQKVSRKEFVPTCYHCGILGHIRPHCKLLQKPRSVFIYGMKTKAIWVKKSDLKCYVVHTALKALNSDLCYLDSGCSRHMSGDKSLFSNLEKHERGVVTFGDGNSSTVIGKGKVSSPGVPILENVLYVKGLKANLVSISQFCDEDYEVKFSKTNCIILDHDGNVICYGSRTSDNCYVVGTSHKLKCNNANHARTPMSTTTKLGKDTSGKSVD